MAKIRKALLAGASTALGVAVTALLKSGELTSANVASAVGAGVAAGVAAGWATWRVPNAE
ncbi:MAG TPA: hypothetical protein VFX60_12995 [Micromonospora sp.]|nr:hypothetical protein [Micromonospora sp.]